MENEKLIDGIFKDAVQIYSKESLLKRLRSGKPLTIKLGADPSRPDLHLGHAVILRKLRLFQELGHRVVFVIGDFTGMIGDPTGRSKTRPALTLEQTRASGETYFRQVTKILDPERTEIRYNSKWLNTLDFSQVIALASKYTLAQMLARDDFHNRFEGGIPIGLHELLYPLVQGYDSVALGADVEIGGTDQTFNLLVGRALQSDFGQTPQEVITYPLLVGLDGRDKMSKSLGNFIGLDEPAESMYEKAMRVPDELLPAYFALTTDIPEKEAAEWIRKDVRDAHFHYADTIVTLFHGSGAAKAAGRRYRDIASGSQPVNMPELQIPGETLTDGRIRITELLQRAGLAGSGAEARRSILGRGVKLDGVTVEDPALQVDLSRPAVIQLGKNKFCRASLN